MKYIPDNSVDLVVIDPPYKLRPSSANTTFGGVVGKENKYAKNGSMFKYNSIKSSDWFPELFRVLKEETHCYVMCNSKYVKEYLIEGEKAGFKQLNILIWAKGMHTPTQYYMRNTEFILMFRKGKAKYINNMGSFSLIDIKGIRGNKVHPSEKPVQLMEHLILNSSNENDTVLDCFMGSGSTGIACVNNNRKFIGIELDENYFNIAKGRIEDTYKN